MTDQSQELADWMEHHFVGNHRIAEVLEKAPHLSMAEAYAVQDELERRRLAAGEIPLGWKMALTSKAMQARLGIPQPVYGHLWTSGLHPDQAEVSVASFPDMRAEPEIAVLLKSGLSGPGVTLPQVLLATAGYLPAIEIGDMRALSERRSQQMVHVCNAFNGGQLLGTRITPPTLVDGALEGMVITRNGEFCGSAAGAEIMGHPLHAVMALANLLGQRGKKLEAGMIVLTGSLIPNITCRAGDTVRVSFTHLGSVTMRVVA